MSGIGVVTNPLSRRNKSNPRLADRLAYILGEKGRLAMPKDLEGMEAVARHFLEREIDIICINGGDGTGHVVLTAFARVYGDRPLPMVALLRGGTMNTVAHGLGIKGTPSALLDQVVSKYHEGEPFSLTERTLLCVNNRLYGFIWGAGAITTYMDLYYEGGDASPTKGAMVLGRLVAAAMFRTPLLKRITDPLVAQVTADGERLPATRFIALAAATVDDLGFGFRPFREAPANQGRMHALGFACGAGTVAMELPRFYLARPARSPDIHSRLPERLLVESNRPVNIIVDGDFYRCGPVVEVKTGPRVRMIVG